MSDSKSCLHVLVKGRVQGVWYRASARDQARRLGVAGWVRNRADGSVEALVRGPQPRLAEFVAWCRQGPPGARVDAVETEPLDEAPALPFPFEVQR